MNVGVLLYCFVFTLLCITVCRRWLEKPYRLQIRELSRALAEADTDPVTGLLTRRAWIRKFSETADDRTGAVIVLLDIDRFKEINDRYGHPFGDHVLASVGARLTAAVPPGSLIARWGGDEFVALVNAGTATELAARAFAPPLPVAGTVVPVTVSVGAVVLVEGVTIDAQLAHADQLMYADKNSKRAGSRSPR